MTKEQRFYQALRDVFVGAKLEGTGGFINLMRIKSDYYRRIEAMLRADIEKALQKHPAFRDELFDKLYTFFRRYFTESGSICFHSTPFHNDVYEKVYTNNRDVILFWKTQMLYYVKTDRIFRSLPVEFDDLKFYFDASKVEAKKANEKRSLVYRLDQVRNDGTIVFTVQYSERGTKTKQEQILRSIRKEGIAITKEQLERAFRIFERQSEVDFFINKNAKAFLQEQFKLWSYQYFWEGAEEWTAERVRQLQILKDIAFKIIDFIAQFEDELVKIWNKPKFVKNAHYVLSLKTLKKLVDENTYHEIVKEVSANLLANTKYREDVMETIREIYKQPLQKVYVHKVTLDGSWWKLEYVKVFNTEQEREIYLSRRPDEKAVDGELFDRNRKIPGYLATYSSASLTTKVSFERTYIDTRYFDSRFTNRLLEAITEKTGLDEALDGYLIKSDCYHVLAHGNKFKNRVKLIYLDPPFNTAGSYAFLDKFKDSTWLSMMKDRLQLGRDFLTQDGSFYIHLDENCNQLGRFLLDSIFGRKPEREIIWNTGEALSGFKTQAVNWVRQHDTILYYAKDTPSFQKMFVKNTDEDIPGLGWLDIFKDENGDLFVYKYPEGKDRLEKVKLPQFPIKTIGDVWNDIYSMMYTQNMTRENWGQDNTQKPENLLRRIIQSATNEGDFVFDYFTGSGTTLAAAHKLNRKWIGVEMGEYIESIVLRRMKTVVFGDIRSKLTEDLNWQGGGFFKYYELEQYEETLANCTYENGDLFSVPGGNPYQAYVFMKDEKLLKAIELDYDNNKVKVELSKLYPNIDIAETLSYLTGKWITRIAGDLVEFEDGTTVNTKDLDFRVIKPLIWWE